VRAASPAVRSTKELVHRFLFTGKIQPHAQPAAATIAPAAKRPASRSLRARRAPIQDPATTPKSVVATAGIVDSGPSGSHVLVRAQVWFPMPHALQSRSRRSTHAASVAGG